MAQTQKRSSPVVLAFFLVVLSGASLAMAFYFLDGASLVSDALESDLADRVVALVEGWFGDGDTGGGGTGGSTTPTSTPGALDLPEGVSREFALRTWAEQVQSQVNIGKLLNGEVRELRFGSNSGDNYAEKMTMTVKFADGTSAPGELYLRKAGENWYVEGLRGMRKAVMGGSADSVGRAESDPPLRLPDISQVDIGVLNTIFDQQAANQPVFEDYVAGNVTCVSIDGVVRGPRTATIAATMYEKDETVKAEIVAVSTTVSGEEQWFLARFRKVATAK
ncbi:MAG: hypothetical protein FDZ70_01985 [Actinobacteria bacterium]|nr:MAG: hypothetical protein FDZ70_01985 [Actinomycetota bacterium]